MVSQHTVEDQVLMGVQTGLAPRYSVVVASFTVSYPAILAGSKAGLDSIQVRASVDFGAMMTF